MKNRKVKPVFFKITKKWYETQKMFEKRIEKLKFKLTKLRGGVKHERE